jgi:hypothetical protein
MSWADEHGLAARLTRGDDKADRLPLILCGPILRRTEPDSVTVWVALKEPRTVTLRVYSHAPPPAVESLREELQGTRRTVRLGEHLHVVAVTARPVEAERPLAPGTIYFYNLFFSATEVSPVPETADQLNTPNVFELAGASSLDGLQPTGLSYSIEHKLPSFSLPPQDLNKLRIIHGSCRQPQGTGRDALPTLDEIISLDFPVADERPHLLLLTGDQIYADDVAHSLLFLLMDADSALLGWSESLPEVTSDLALRLKPGLRKPITIGTAGFTTEDPDGQLFSLGEYYAMYLFAWSDVLWPVQFPQFDDVKNDSLRESDYKSERSSLLEFRKAIPQVRRALANVPTYMMVDDHDITDDWNMLRAWCERVYTRPLGRRVVQNGLLAYAVFQAWGNTPDRFAASQAGEALLTAAAAWSASKGTNSTHEQEIAKLVGIPGTLSADGQLTGLFTRVGEFFQLSVKDSLRWHYTIKGPKFEILVLDSRTQRSFTEDKYAPPAHMGPGALEEQVPLDDVDPNKLILIVSTNNLFTVPSLHEEKVFGRKFIFEWWYIAFRIGVDILLPLLQLIGKAPKFEHFNPDQNESWMPQTQPFEALLSRLSRRTAVAAGTRKARILILTGDVHFSFASRMQYWADRPFEAESSAAQPVEAIFAQLASSPFKKEEGFAAFFHTTGYIPMIDSLPGAIRWFGWKERSSIGISPRDMGRMADWVHMPDAMMGHTPPMLSLIDAPSTGVSPRPDWRYRIDFMLGEKSGIEFTLNTLEKPEPSDTQKWFRVVSEAQTRHRNYAQKWGDGLELVGKNSLGELRLQWEGGTTLIAGIGADDNSFRIAAPNVLPAFPLLITIDDEIIKVGEVHRGTGECSQVVRGQRGTKKAPHASDAAVKVFQTATQTQWWRLTSETKLLPLTTYTLSLSYLDPQFPKPKLPREADS